MGIPVLSMLSDLASGVAAGNLPPDLANSLKSANLPSNLTSGLASGDTSQGMVSSLLGVAPFGSLIFGAVGAIAIIVAKKSHNWKHMLIGFVLVGYTFLPFKHALTVYAIGIVLCGLLYFFREENPLTSMD